MHDAPRAFALKPILAFLVPTFGLTFVLESWLLSTGLRFTPDQVQTAPALWLLAVMWIPGLAAVCCTLFVDGVPLKKLLKSLNVRVGALGPYVFVMGLVPILYMVMYGLSWAMGLTSPDLTLSGLVAAAGADQPLDPDTVFYVLLPMSIVLGPLINLPFGLGEELGWRGYLLPRLIPLGRARAFILLGLLWGLWHAPLIWAGFNYPGHPIGGLAIMCLLTTAFGWFVNAMTLHYRSTLLAAFIHGAVNAQGFGIWMWLFPGVHPLLGGGVGLTGVIVWSCAATAMALTLARKTQDNPVDLDAK